MWTSKPCIKCHTNTIEYNKLSSARIDDKIVRDSTQHYCYRAKKKAKERVPIVRCCHVKRRFICSCGKIFQIAEYNDAEYGWIMYVWWPQSQPWHALCEYRPWPWANDHLQWFQNYCISSKKSFEAAWPWQKIWGWWAWAFIETQIEATIWWYQTIWRGIIAFLYIFRLWLDTVVLLRLWNLSIIWLNKFDMDIIDPESQICVFFGLWDIFCNAKTLK